MKNSLKFQNQHKIAIKVFQGFLVIWTVWAKIQNAELKETKIFELNYMASFYLWKKRTIFNFPLFSKNYTTNANISQSNESQSFNSISNRFSAPICKKIMMILVDIFLISAHVLLSSLHVSVCAHMAYRCV